MTYNYKNSRHRLEAMVGQEVNYSNYTNLTGEAERFPTDLLQNDNLGLGALPTVVNSIFNDKLLMSFFSRVNYHFKDRYLLTASIRADGGTVFSKHHKWGWFPSFSAAWRISEEPFIKNIDFISNLKLRAGWGVVGNDRIASYLSLDLYEPNKLGMGYTTVTTLQSKQLPNRDLKWEGSETTNIGLEIGLFKNRLNITVDAFIKDTKDLLLAKSLSGTSGFTLQWQNIGKVRNKGLEVTLNSVNISKKDFSWTTDFNISFIDNKLISLEQGEQNLYARSAFDGNFAANDYISIVGSSIGNMYGYVFDGVYQLSDFNVNASTGKYELKEGITDISDHYGQNVQPGVVKYKDLDDDGKITDKDRTSIGRGIPKWFGGITNTLNYKGIDLSFMFQFNYGNDVFNATRIFNTQTQMDRYNMLGEVADRWTATNASQDVPSATGYVTNDVYSRFIEDGSFLRLKNLTLGYTFPKRWIRKIHLSKLRVYATAQNLFVITNYTGYDPEVSMRTSNPLTPNVDWGAYPRSRSFTFGLDIQF